MFFDSLMVSFVSAPSLALKQNKNLTHPLISRIPHTRSKAHESEQIEQALLTSDEWLGLATQSSELGLWYWDEVGQNLNWDAKTREMFGAPSAGEVTLQTFIDALHPDDRDRVLRTWRHEFEARLPYQTEFRAVRADGGIRWIQARGKGHYDGSAKPVCMVGVVLDITERKQAEKQRAELSGRLINAQEEERRHLARELHDDFSQRLALLANQLEIVRRIVDECPKAAIEQIQALKQDVTEIGVDLHALSRRLHSSKLELLGVARSIASCCAEFAKQEHIEVDFGHRDIPKSLPPETALCLFRIVQEGLRNVGKHSHASKVEVQLTGRGAEISLSLCDNGIGFEPCKVSASHGIGIQSMNERARMVGGRFELRASPMRGTQITVEVPLENHSAE